MPDVAISWYCVYHSSYVVKIRNVVPGDCHVAAFGRLLAMTYLYVFCNEHNDPEIVAFWATARVAPTRMCTINSNL